MESVVDCIVPSCAEHGDSNGYLRWREMHRARMEEDRVYVEKMRTEFLALLDPFKNEFSLFLRSFQRGALQVRPVCDALHEQTVSVFSQFGIDISGIVPTSPEEVDYLLTLYGECIDDEVRMDETFQADMGLAIRRNDVGYIVCSELYDEALKRDWHGAVFCEDRFASIRINGAFNRLGRFMGMRVRDLVTAYLYLRVMHIKDFEARVQALLGLYLQGNYPVRILNNKTLLVATAS